MAQPQIDDTRKTSNGCSVARRVARGTAGFRQPSDNIAAIDFGTTNCSLAYILPGEMTEHGPNMLPFDGTFYRVPTAILFRKNGAVKAFGVTARKTYGNLGDEERLECAYFEQIKMDLQHDELVNREMTIKAKNGKEYYLVEVIAHIIKYLKDQLILKLQWSGYKLEATDFDWVITVPAIWRARGKQMMREAGYKAGLCSTEVCPELQVATGRISETLEEEHPEKLSLALEPESAAIFCQKMSQQQLAPSCRVDPPFTASSYLIIDIGGGTVDISAHCLRRNPQMHISVVHPPTGNDFGGSRVNKEFQVFLEALVRDDGFERFVSTSDKVVNARNQAYLNELLNVNFEKQKIVFAEKEDTSDSSHLAVELPYEFLVTYSSDLSAGIAESGEAQIRLVGQDLRISCQLMKRFIEPIKNGIVQCIKQTLDEVDQINKIYLVGGFGGCKYMVRAIQEYFTSTHLDYIVPVEPAYAVVKGAVLYKQNPEVIESRKVDATYGIGTNRTFDEDLYDPKYQWVNDDGKLKCKSLFSTIVERSDVVGSGEVFIQTYHPVSHKQRKMTIKIYSSQQKDIFYVTGEWGKDSRNSPATVNKIGSITIVMPDLTGDKNRAVDVTFNFSHTEIQVKVFDQTSKNEVKTVLDFLTSSE